MTISPYLPANKEGTLLQQAQYWLEKAVEFAADPAKAKSSEMAFNMALKREQEHHAQASAS